MCQTEKFWKVFCELMDEPSLTENSEYQTMADRRRQREQISEELDQIFLKHTTEQWLERFQGKIPVAPINDLRQALENPVGENTQAILKEFGFSEAEISELQAEGVV